MNTLLRRVVAGVTVASGAAVLLGPGPVAIVGGLLLAFVLPGLALSDVFFRRRDLTTLERIVLTPALSMGVLIVAGLAMYVATVHMDRVSWTVATAVVTLVAIVAPWVSTLNAPEPEPEPEPEPVPAPGPAGAQPARVGVGERTVRLPRAAVDATVVISIAEVEDAMDVAAQEQAGRRRLARQLLPLALVVLMLGGACWLSFGNSRSTHDTTVTALWAAPPGPVDAAGNRRVEVSASGLLAADGPYKLRVLTAAGKVALARTVPVTGDGSWTEALSVPGAQRMTVNLYRARDTTAYRTLFLGAVD
ncbi:hypothetical protein [Actinoplanes sp. NPDC026623]|uniref:hypothetical protein n=1 Tax=Actinoplanes sp. NPDC026623 TaxID=3155610 RepID=UPI0033FA77B9